MNLRKGEQIQSVLFPLEWDSINHYDKSSGLTGFDAINEVLYELGVKKIKAHRTKNKLRIRILLQRKGSSYRTLHYRDGIEIVVQTIKRTCSKCGGSDHIASNKNYH